MGIYLAECASWITFAINHRGEWYIPALKDVEEGLRTLGCLPDIVRGAKSGENYADLTLVKT